MVFEMPKGQRHWGSCGNQNSNVNMSWSACVGGFIRLYPDSGWDKSNAITGESNASIEKLVGCIRGCFFRKQPSSLFSVACYTRQKRLLLLLWRCFSRLCSGPELLLSPVFCMRRARLSPRVFTRLLLCDTPRLCDKT